jgi:hypothetical protein
VGDLNTFRDIYGTHGSVRLRGDSVVIDVAERKELMKLFRPISSSLIDGRKFYWA